MHRPQTVVFDIDGTLADVSSVRHHVINIHNEAKFKKNFDKFHEESVSCPPIRWVLASALDAKGMGFRVIQVTARQEKYRPHTSWWLADNYVPSDGLYMRANGDFRPDYVVKREILDRLILRYDIRKAFDDNPNVVRLWSEYDIPCVVVPGWIDD